MGMFSTNVKSSCLILSHLQVTVLTFNQESVLYKLDIKN